MIARASAVSNIFLRERAAEIKGLGFGAYDSLHLSCVEKGKTVVSLSTDKKLLKPAEKHIEELKGTSKNSFLRKEVFRGPLKVLARQHSSLRSTLVDRSAITSNSPL